MFAQHRVAQVVIQIYCAIQALPGRCDAIVRFSEISGRACLSRAFEAEPICEGRGEVSAAVTDSLVGELEAACQVHRSEAAQAQPVAETPRDEQQDSIG